MQKPTPQPGKTPRSNGRAHDDPYAFPLDTPEDLRNRLAGRGSADGGQPAPPQTQQPAQADNTPAAPKSAPATETLAKRLGALSDEVNFPAFVASLVHGTYDAVVDAAIRQMEAYADLVSAVAKDADQFTAENVSRGQVLDYLVHQYPRDLVLDAPTGPNAGPAVLHPRNQPASDGSDGGDSTDDTGPAWLADYGLQGPLTDDLIEQQLIPAAQKRVGGNRLQTLATMVLLGMNRINVKDGSISAKVRFRAAAADTAQVNYAVTNDPANGNLGDRGSAVYDQHVTMVSTVGANVQTGTEINAELYGEVRINFVSETLPLDRFADAASLAVLQRNGRPKSTRPAQQAAAPAPPAEAVPPASAPGGGK